MKRILTSSFLALMLMLSACSDNKEETPETNIAEEDIVAENKSNNELTEIEKENETLRKELAEKENETLRQELKNKEQNDSQSDPDKTIEKDETNVKNESVDNSGENKIRTVLTDSDYTLLDTMISDYLYLLGDYYNGISDSVFNYLNEGTPAYNKITANKNSGNFTKYFTSDIGIRESQLLDDGTVLLSVNRVYAHATSDGQRHAVVEYIIDLDNFIVIDFNQIDDRPHMGGGY